MGRHGPQNIQLRPFQPLPIHNNNFNFAIPNSVPPRAPQFVIRPLINNAIPPKNITNDSRPVNERLDTNNNNEWYNRSNSPNHIPAPQPVLLTNLVQLNPKNPLGLEVLPTTKVAEPATNSHSNSHAVPNDNLRTNSYNAKTEATKM